MACPGGCIGGGGQPRSKDKEILRKRQAALYGVDERATLRRSYEARDEEWLGAVSGWPARPAAGYRGRQQCPSASDAPSHKPNYNNPVVARHQETV